MAAVDLYNCKILLKLLYQLSACSALQVLDFMHLKDFSDSASYRVRNCPSESFMQVQEVIFHIFHSFKYDETVEAQRCAIR